MKFEEVVAAVACPSARPRWGACLGLRWGWVTLSLIVVGLAACSRGRSPTAESPATADEAKQSVPPAPPEESQMQAPAPKPLATSSREESSAPIEQSESEALSEGDKERDDAVPKRAAVPRRARAAKVKAKQPSRGGGLQSKQEASAQLLAEQLGELVVARSSFNRSLELKDCGAAAAFADSICSLAERICQVEQELPSSSVRCPESRQSCKQARKRLAESCP